MTSPSTPPRPAQPSGVAWRHHVALLGVLAALAGVVTIVDLTSSTPGAWVSLRGMGAWLCWGAYAAFAVVTTVLFALRPRGRAWPWIVYPGTLALVVAAWYVPAAVRKDRERAEREQQGMRAAATECVRLERWSITPAADGRSVVSAVLWPAPGHDLMLRVDVEGPADGGRRSARMSAWAPRIREIRWTTTEPSTVAVSLPASPDEVRHAARLVVQCRWNRHRTNPPPAPTHTIIYEQGATASERWDGEALFRPLPPPANGTGASDAVARDPGGPTGATSARRNASPPLVPVVEYAC